jgi:hypothetical protein
MGGGGEPWSVEFGTDARRFRAPTRDGTIVAGYGAYRLPGRETKSPPRAGGVQPRVDSVLDPYARLLDPEPWLLECDQPTFDAAARALKRLLMDDDAVLHRRGGDVRFVSRDMSVSLNQLSAGYRSMVALAADLMCYMLTRWETLEAAEGVVLVDEIGTHLHPRWQMRVVSAFREAFPRLQFIASTHDPLCLRGLRAGEVIVLRRDEDRRVYVLEDLPSVEGLYVDQLLTSEHFGLESTLDPALEETFAEYYDLLSRRKLSKSQQRRVAALRHELAERRQLGFTARERLALEAADEALARKRREADPAAREKISSDAETRIADIWAASGL